MPKPTQVLFVLTLVLSALRQAESVCGAGKYLQNESCLQCLEGTYKEGEGEGPCIPCPVDEDGRNGSTSGSGNEGIHNCYFRPYIKHFEPAVGAQAGGTKINITMGHFATRDVKKIWVANIEPTVVERGPSYIIVKTSASSNLRNGTVQIFMTDDITEYIVKSTTKYSYGADPIITEIVNPQTIMSGGIPLIVKGERLTVVTEAIMIITRVYKTEVDLFHSLCDVVNSTMMKCPTPDLTVGMETLEKDEEVTDIPDDTIPISTTAPDTGITEIPAIPSLNQTTTTNISIIIKNITINNGTHIITRTVIITTNTTQTQTQGRRRRDAHAAFSSEDFKFFVGFQLDGVSAYNNFSTLPVYDDPVYHLFEEPNRVQKFSPEKERFLRIYGERLNHGVRMEDVNVFVGIEICWVTSLSTNVLTCIPPQTPPKPGSDGKGPHGSVRVLVNIGRLEYVVGFVYYTKLADTLSSKMIILILALIGIFLLWLLTLWVAVKWFCPKWQACRGRSKGDTGSSGSSAEQQLYPPDQSDGSNGTSSMESQEGPLAPWDIVVEFLDEDLKMKVSECTLEGDTLDLKDCIGIGSFGRVFKGILKEGEHQTTVAVKTLKGITQNYESELSQFLEEALVMKGFLHPNILSLHGVVILEYSPYVVLEYMDKGDLKNYVSKKKDILVGDLVEFGLQVSEGMTYLATRGFVHRDLAARNCLINGDNIVKIGDFGLSRDLHGTDYYRIQDKGRPLPIKWMAFESLNLGKFTSKSDVWSFGVLIWELLARGRSPYAHVNNMDLKDYIREGHRLDKPKHATDKLYVLMSNCWHESPDDRPTFGEITDKLKEILENKSLLQEET